MHWEANLNIVYWNTIYKQENIYLGVDKGKFLILFRLHGINPFKFFLKMMKYDSLDHKRYKKSDFEWLGYVDKFAMINIVMGHYSLLISEATF